MPEVIKSLPQSFYDNIENLSFQEIAYQVADAFFGEDVLLNVVKNLDNINVDASEILPPFGRLNDIKT